MTFIDKSPRTWWKATKGIEGKSPDLEAPARDDIETQSPVVMNLPQDAPW